MHFIGRRPPLSVQASGRTDCLRALGRTDWVLAVRPPSDRQSDGLTNTLLVIVYKAKLGIVFLRLIGNGLINLP